jgi:thiamine phosphate synthase YjbQ (UPF0047 family)
MSAPPRELKLTLTPRSRYDVIDVAACINSRFGNAIDGYRRVLYCSHHTTAGYLDQRVLNRLLGRRGGVDPFMRRFQKLFPRGAGYRHDDIHLRCDLSDDQRLIEPPNGDAHLTFIGSGLQNCVTYRHLPGNPVFFMDLDGVFEGRYRSRTSSVVAYSTERPVTEFCCEIPVSRHAIDSVNLYDDRLGLRARIEELLRRYPIATGRLDIALDNAEDEAAVTVNEYETLLMRHDLAEVLNDPLRFVARQGRRMLSDPRSVPAKSLGYARYDLVLLINRFLEWLEPDGSAIERFISRLMALPAARRLRLKRSLSLAVSRAGGGSPRVVRGLYQTPILIQWRPTPRRARRLRVTLVSFE